MDRRLIIVAPVLFALFASACGGGSSSSPPAPSAPSAPTPTPTPTATRIIDVFSDKDFGEVEVGGAVILGFVIRNTGTATLTVTSLTVSPGHESVFTMKYTGDTIPPGELNQRHVLLRFAPGSVQSYTGVLTVRGDQTSGKNTLNYSGVGTPSTPIWTLSGNGARVFDMPAKVRNFLFTADYAGDRAELVVYREGSPSFSAVLGTATGGTHYEVSGISSGHYDVRCPSDVRWSFAERKQPEW
jgi:hypothetical protein